jgi:putative transposase
MEWFRNRIDAKITIEQFRRQYNEVRPHSSLGQLTPAEFKQQLSSTTNPAMAIT